MQLAIRDVNQGPFLTQVLRFGRESEHLSDQQLGQIKGKAVLMSLKFADKYYNKYKMHLLEQAAHDVIGVVSLGLQELSGRDNARALALLQAPEGPIKPFQKGWSMLISVSAKQPVATASMATWMPACWTRSPARRMWRSGKAGRSTRRRGWSITRPA